MQTGKMCRKTSFEKSRKSFHEFLSTVINLRQLFVHLRPWVCVSEISLTRMCSIFFCNWNLLWKLLGISEAKFVSVLAGPLKGLIGLSDSEINDLADYFRIQDGRILYSQLCEVIHDNGTILTIRKSVSTVFQQTIVIFLVFLALSLAKNSWLQKIHRVQWAKVDFIFFIFIHQRIIHTVSPIELWKFLVNSSADSLGENDSGPTIGDRVLNIFWNFDV